MDKIDISRIRILNENGYQRFLGIKKLTKDCYLDIKLSNNTTIKCSENHQFMKEDDYVLASSLKIDDKLYSFCEDIYITDIVKINEAIDLYDIIDVECGNSYKTNGILSHNCHFLSSNYTLVDTQIINQIEELNKVEDVKFVFSVGDQGFWKKIHKEYSYIVGVDISEGVGQDYSVIEVFEFPSLTQVMELRTNVTLQPQLYKILKNILIYLQHYGGDVYFSVENNGLGAGIITLYQVDENPPDAMFISEQGKDKLGFNTNSKTKPKTCLLLREMIMRNQIRIYSQTLLNELKSFVSKGGTYQAATGATDDCISATLIVLRILEEIASYEENAYNKLFVSGLEEIEKDKNGNFLIDEWSKENFEDLDEGPLPFIFI